MLAKATFFLPLLDNDGRDLSAEQQEVRKQVYDLFDGWTLLGYFEGAFRMPDGTQSLDKSAAYMVVLEAGRIGELEAVLRAFKAKTLQEAIYLEIQRGVEFRFVREDPR
jgi:hypothetical protein